MIEEWKHVLLLNLVCVGIVAGVISLLTNVFTGIADPITQTISLVFLIAYVTFLLLPMYIQKKFQRFTLYIATAMMLSYWTYVLYGDQPELTRVSIMFGIALAYPLLFGFEFILSPASRALKESIAKILLMIVITLPYAIITRNSSEALTGFPVIMIPLTIYAGFLVILYNFAML